MDGKQVQIDGKQGHQLSKVPGSEDCLAQSSQRRKGRWGSWWICRCVIPELDTAVCDGERRHPAGCVRHPAEHSWDRQRISTRVLEKPKMLSLGQDFLSWVFKSCVLGLRRSLARIRAFYRNRATCPAHSFAKVDAFSKHGHRLGFRQ